MKSSVVLALFLVASPFCKAGKITMMETTPPELSGAGITYEKIGFEFETEAYARFWIEYDAGDGTKPRTIEVPRNDSDAMKSHTLIYVQRGDELLSLTAVTKSPSPLDRRSCTFSTGDGSGSREFSRCFSSLEVRMDEDIVLYTSSLKPGWREPKGPTNTFTVKARFSAKPMEKSDAGEPAALPAGEGSSSSTPEDGGR
jgi:hypothetical protein